MDTEKKIQLNKIGVGVYKDESASCMCPDCGQKLTHKSYIELNEGEVPCALTTSHQRTDLRISICPCGSVVLRSLIFDSERTVRFKTGNFSVLLTHNQDIEKIR